MTNTALVTISLEALRMFPNEEYEHRIMFLLSRRHFVNGYGKVNIAIVRNGGQIHESEEKR